jgi:putative ABC transport system ATP-binding protein
MMAHSPPLLKVDRVDASHVNETGNRQIVLKQVSVCVDAGEVVAVIGPSGSGKSTLLRLCNRLIEPDAGQILYEGRPISEINPPELRKQVGFLSQKPFLYQGSVRHNLSIPAKLAKKPMPDFAGDQFLELLDLCQVHSDWLDREARKLSVGQQQRVCLARVLMGHCRVLLLDEPTSALDPPTADALTQTFRKLALTGKLAILLVTHDLYLPKICADRMVVLLNGCVVEEGPVAELIRSPKNEAVRRFLVRTDAPALEDQT